MSRPVLKSVLLRLSLPALLALPFAACVTDDSTDAGAPSNTNRTLAADTSLASVDWESHATTFRGQDSLRVAYVCPDSGAAEVVWGSGFYTDDSSVCTAAVHSGLITFAAGGRVVIEIRPGRTSYDSLTRNGVTTLPYGVWGGSYVFP